ncbi:MAG: hypothetical protein Q7T57_08325, partial [Dehalococcoidales bacterium]|nr:hypothetical protein [Dehalococcoidales bacterium]
IKGYKDSGLYMDTTILYFLIFIGVCLSIATIVFLVKAANKHDWGNTAVASAMLAVAVIGWIFSLQQGYLSTPVGNPTLEVTDQIETTGGGSIYLTWVTVLNRGTGNATNCVIEIECRTPEEKEYKYLGYTLFQREKLAPHTQSRFWLVRARSYDEGAHWETCIMLKDIRDYADQDSVAISYPVLAGDYYLRLTVIAENVASSTREFNLYVSQDGTELPKLEAFPQKEVQTE